MAQQPQPVPAQQRHGRRRFHSRAVRRSITVALLVASASWGILALTGYVTLWIHLAFLGVIVLLFVLLILAQPRTPKRSEPSQSHQRSPISMAPDPAPGRSLPRAVTEEYNTLTDFPPRRAMPHSSGSSWRSSPVTGRHAGGHSEGPFTGPHPVHPPAAPHRTPSDHPASSKQTPLPVQPKPVAQPDTASSTTPATHSSPAVPASSPVPPAPTAQTASHVESTASVPAILSAKTTSSAQINSFAHAVSRTHPDLTASGAAPKPTSLAAQTDAAAHPVVTASGEVHPSYHLPTPDLLPEGSAEELEADDLVLGRASLLEEALRRLGAEAKVTDFLVRPDATRFELEPGPGVTAERLTALSGDLALALAAAEVRVHPPYPGKTDVILEVPNQVLTGVPLRTVLEAPAFRDHASPLAVALGQTATGESLIADLTTLPHLLIEGDGDTDGCLRAILCSLLLKARPDQARLLLIDPGATVLFPFASLPHLAAPILSDPSEAVERLRQTVWQLEARPHTAGHGGSLRHATVIAVTDLDKLLTARSDAESVLCRLASMAEACDVHLVAATPSIHSSAITPALLASIPARLTLPKTLKGASALRYHRGGQADPILGRAALVDATAARELAQFCHAQAETTPTA